MLLGQDRACEILRSHLRKYGYEVERGTTLSDLKQDDEGVTATLAKLDGEQEEVRAKYLIGADGAKGRSRCMPSVRGTKSIQSRKL